MYNGDSNNNDSNNEYSTISAGNYNNGYSENGYSTGSNNYMNSNYNGTMNSAGMMMDFKNEAATCRTWMITSLVLYIVSALISFLGIVAFIVSIIAMVKVKEIFDKLRLYPKLALFSTSTGTNNSDGIGLCTFNLEMQ